MGSPKFCHPASPRPTPTIICLLTLWKALLPPLCFNFSVLVVLGVLDGHVDALSHGLLIPADVLQLEKFESTTLLGLASIFVERA